MKKIATLIFFFLLFVENINSQSVTLSVVQLDCNQDGILQVNTIGITPPYNVVLYRNYVSPVSIVATQNNITTFTTQINGLTGATGNYPLSYVAEIKQGSITVATSTTQILPKENKYWTTLWNYTITYSCPSAGITVSLGLTGGNRSLQCRMGRYIYSYYIYWRSD